MKVHISQFYPCSKVTLACELYYICELGKYMYYNHEGCVSLDGVILDSILDKSPLWDYFRLALSKGWVVDTNVSEAKVAITPSNPLNADKTLVENYLYTFEPQSFDYTDFNKRREDALYAYTEPYKCQLYIHERHENTKTIGNDSYWLFTREKLSPENSAIVTKALGNNLACQLWLSIIAFAATERLVHNNPARFLLKIDNTMLATVGAFSYVILMSEQTSCFEGWFYYTFDENISMSEINQLGYYAWYTEGKDKGIVGQWYSPKQKLSYMQKNGMGVGSVILLYTRVKDQQRNFMKSIESCIVAIIRDIKATSNRTYSITVETCHTMKPYYQAKLEFEDYVTSVKTLWVEEKPYERFRSSTLNLDLCDLGVEYLLYSELNFITSLNCATDFREAYVTDGVRKDRLVLPQNDYIYWVLKDYNIEFDEEAYIKQYIPNGKPAYETYMAGGALADSYYYVDPSSTYSETYMEEEDDD